jgi:hypothetical protein
VAASNKTTLTKHRIREIMARLEAREPVAPEAELWTLADCLTVAGVLLSSAMTADSFARATTEGSRERPEERLKEFQATIEFVAAMATAHRNGTWDEYFDTAVTIGIGAGRCTPLSGFKR